MRLDRAVGQRDGFLEDVGVLGARRVVAGSGSGTSRTSHSSGWTQVTVLWEQGDKAADVNG